MLPLSGTAGCQIKTEPVVARGSGHSNSSKSPIRLPKTAAEPVILSWFGANILNPEEASLVLKVYVVNPSARQQVPMPVQGRYTQQTNAICFTPFFPFLKGQRYRVEWRCSAASDAPHFTAPFQIVDRDVEALPRVLAIAPSAPVLPATTLRFYITFSCSMRGKFDRRQVHLTDEAGDEITRAFMIFGEELWSTDGHRLTLLFDPGRIKRGIIANVTEGPPLTPRHLYTLSITPPHVPSQAFTFRVAGPLRTPLNPAAWRLTPPIVATRKPLILRFDRVMDSALLEDSIAVCTTDGQHIAGTILVEKGEQVWHFTPLFPWHRCAYNVVFSPGLEDVSGNRIGEALDHENRPTQTEHSTFVFPFQAH